MQTNRQTSPSIGTRVLRRRFLPSYSEVQFQQKTCKLTIDFWRMVTVWSHTARLYKWCFISLMPDELKKSTVWWSRWAVTLSCCRSTSTNDFLEKKPEKRLQVIFNVPLFCYSTLHIHWYYFYNVSTTKENNNHSFLNRYCFLRRWRCWKYVKRVARFKLYKDLLHQSIRSAFCSIALALSCAL